MRSIYQELRTGTTGKVGTRLPTLHICCQSDWVRTMRSIYQELRTGTTDKVGKDLPTLHILHIGLARGFA